MSTEETRATVRRFVEAWNAPDLVQTMALVGENFVGYEPGQCNVRACPKQSGQTDSRKRDRMAEVPDGIRTGD